MTNADLLTPFPLFQGITQTNYPWARYRYDSLQLRLEKRVLDFHQGTEPPRTRHLIERRTDEPIGNPSAATDPNLPEGSVSLR